MNLNQLIFAMITYKNYNNFNNDKYKSINFDLLNDIESYKIRRRRVLQIHVCKIRLIVRDVQNS